VKSPDKLTREEVRAVLAEIQQHGIAIWWPGEDGYDHIALSRDAFDRARRVQLSPKARDLMIWLDNQVTQACQRASEAAEFN